MTQAFGGSNPPSPAKKKQRRMILRTLVFNVKGQMIEKSMSCDFSGLVAGTDGYLKAKFIFSKEWDGFAKVAQFLSKDDNELPPRIISIDGECDIPKEASERHEFKVRVYGKKNGATITTRPISIKQYGGI